MTRRLLVTGATGFIGTAAARALLVTGAEVHGVTASGRASPPGVMMHQADLLDEAATAGLLQRLRPTHLLHVAWDVTHGAYWTSPANFTWLAAGARLLRDFLAAGGQRAVGVGTCAEYVWEGDLYTEHATPLAPATPYGRCKLAMGEAFAAAGLMGASTAWARVFFPYGPGDGPQRFLPVLRRSLLAGEPVDTAAGTQIRDFIHVEDVAGALAALLLSPVTGPVNIGTGEGVALREVALELAAALGADPGLLRFGALPIRPGDPPSLVADVTRLREEVGFAPRIAWRDGVRRFARGEATTTG
jgi:nucleoside-diphosphate-sugar epimerase